MNGKPNEHSSTATKRHVRISKYLARHLRHDPDRIGLVLDAHGWARTDELLAAAAAHNFRFTRAELEEVVAHNDKQRYAFSPDGTRIRANQGHTVDVELDLPALPPPPVLFHGTTPRFLSAIRDEGLRPMTRHAVHLSPDRETAARVGARRGRAVVLTAAAGFMHEEGHTFWRSENGVWLTEAVPPCYLTFPG
ncbi:MULTISPECIES: RNA 2'-phosphotransferase [unclassified Streptomyces]|uniref:RNA 2'-phosphotransferase n=1 Tax=unclassified Streptomyces TaxID=2593676 RepID=UPI002DDB122A|nr:MULTISPECIES: RNA 2'-phosphotransferase [unclassified Streptomyces]WSA93699.1 RNA 2'-phosphotransferase [Streptomyces sp. NBC_01795]WSS13677.1 RNA 2'-phosphotransferase [Streptomyces sp. NBC_01186]WSS42499.1 RNA 2'-phosphotransferase [Streptomyces sp. NBC_01187]